MIYEKVLLIESARRRGVGGGFYDYGTGASDGLVVVRDRRYAALAELLHVEPPLQFNGGGKSP